MLWDIHLGSFIAQAFTTSHPEKVNNLILVASTCGGKDGIPPPPEFIKLNNEVANKSLNNIPTTADEMKQLNVASLGSGWIKLHPESLDTISRKHDIYYNRSLA